MVSAFTAISTIGAALAILAGVILSPIPRNLGLYRFLASKDLALVGLTPAFHHGIEWQYSYEKLYENCSKEIKGQTALITGANSGVGYETARALAKCGVHVTMACRNAKRCAAAGNKIMEELKNDGLFVEDENHIETMIVDTSSLKSVQKFSQEYLQKQSDAGSGALDMLYLNAGIASSNMSKNEPLVLSEDGIELVFATNYVGHHLMYKLLEPLLQKSKMARVIQTSSVASFDTFDHKVATSLDVLNDPSVPMPKYAMQYYGQSKLAQILWSKHLTNRLGDNSTIYVNACHPGAVNTFIWDKIIGIPTPIMVIVNYVRKHIIWTSEEGALTQLYLGVATSELIAKDIRGKYFHPQVQEVVNPLSLDEKLQVELWKFSDELVSKFL